MRRALFGILMAACHSQSGEVVRTPPPTELSLPKEGSCSAGTRSWYPDPAPFRQVRVGIPASDLHKMGSPTACHGDVWFFKAGRPDGPYTVFQFTVQGGKVTHVESHSVACDYKL